MHTYPDPEEAANASSFTSANAIGIEEDQLGYNPQLNCGYDPQLRDDRCANKRKLKRRFEHIFDKYEQDFEGIGDEIDLTTGEIVVNNGHLQKMRNERDNGTKHASKSQLDNEACGPEQSDSNDFADESSDGDDEGLDDAASGVGDDGGMESDLPSRDVDPSLSLPLGHRPARKRRRNAEASVSDADPDDDMLVPAENVLQQIPGLEDSVLSFQSNCKRGQAIDQDAIQALGMSIANQLASFMSRRAPTKSANTLDQLNVHGELRTKDKSGKRRRNPSPLPDLLGTSPNGKKSIWAPTRHPRRQKRRSGQDSEAAQLIEQSENDSAAMLGSEKETSVAPPQPLHGSDLRKCSNCNGTSSVWRKGADRDLCNTCGMYFYRYGLMKPIASSTADKELMTRGENSKTQVDDDEVDPLERDWWLDYDSGCSETRKKSIKLVGVKNSPFIVEEDALLIQLKEIDMFTWERMTSYFPGRSAYALQCRYSKKLRGQAPEARKILVDQGYRGSADDNGIVVFSYTRAPFTDEEDTLLLKLRDEEKLEWDSIAEAIPGRSQDMLERRYFRLACSLLDDGQAYQSDGSQRPVSRDSSISIQRGVRYTDEEDSLIIKLREVDKLSWVKIVEFLNGRNAFSIQKRYIRVLCGRHPHSIMPARTAYDQSLSVSESSRSDRGHSLSLQNNDSEMTQNSIRIQQSDDLQLHSAPGSVNASPVVTLQADQAIAIGHAYSEHEQQLQRELQMQTSDPQDPTMTLARQHTANHLGRRYQLLLPKRKEGESRPVVAQSDVQSHPSPPLESLSVPIAPKVATSKRWTLAESDLLVRLRNLGKSWQQIAAHLPGRTPVAAKTRHAVIASQNKVNPPANSRPLEGVPNSKHDATLLRQAAHNLRRYSEPVALSTDEAHSLNDISTKADAKLEQFADNVDKPQSLLQSLENESHAYVHPETPIQARDIQPVSSSIGPTPAAMAYYATPARYNEQAHPYFLTMPPTFSSPLVTYQPIPQADAGSTAPASAAGFQRNEQAMVAKQVTKANAAQQIPKSGKENRHPRGSHISSTSDEDDLFPGVLREDAIRHGKASSEANTLAMIPITAREGSEMPLYSQRGAKKNVRGNSIYGENLTDRAEAARGEHASPINRDDDKALQVREQTVFDIIYVKARPDETFHHRGGGRWVRGLPPPGASNKIAVRGPGITRKTGSAASGHKSGSNDSTTDVRHEITNDDLEDSSLLSINDTRGALSSPLALARSPNSASGKVPTPSTAGSTLFSPTHKRFRISPKGASGTQFEHRRIRRVTELSDGKRVVHTPVREVNDSEDELAL